MLATIWKIQGIWASPDFLHGLENAVPCKKSVALCETSGKYGIFEHGKMAKVELRIMIDLFANNPFVMCSD